jgi:hypothetical protein
MVTKIEKSRSPEYAPADPFVGTWKLDLARSKYLGAGPKSSTTIIEAVGQGLRATVERIDAHGNAVKVNYGVFFLDGKSYPRGNPMGSVVLRTKVTCPADAHAQGSAANFSGMPRSRSSAHSRIQSSRAEASTLRSAKSCS